MAQLSSLIAELSGVQAAMARIDHECAAYLSAIPEDQQASARNLLHYLALRRHDLRHAQPLLASRGLSSLGRTESHVRDGLETVLRVLHMLEGVTWDIAIDTAPLTKDAGEVLLAAHTDALFGPAPDGRSVRIMVTMPGDAATDYLLIRELVAAGMDCMRINCAHDDAAIWARMIDHLRRANGELRRALSCVDGYRRPEAAHRRVDARAIGSQDQAASRSARPGRAAGCCRAGRRVATALRPMSRRRHAHA